MIPVRQRGTNFPDDLRLYISIAEPKPMETKLRCGEKAKAVISHFGSGFTAPELKLSFQ